MEDTIGKVLNPSCDSFLIGSLCSPTTPQNLLYYYSTNQWLLQSLMDLPLRWIPSSTMISDRHRGPSTFLFFNLSNFLVLNAFSSSEPAIWSSKPPLSPARCRPNRRLLSELRWSLHLWVHSLFFVLLLTNHAWLSNGLIGLVSFVWFCVSHFTGVLVGTGSRRRFGRLFRKRAFRRRISCIRFSFTKVGLFARVAFLELSAYYLCAFWVKHCFFSHCLFALKLLNRSNQALQYQRKWELLKVKDWEF